MNKYVAGAIAGAAATVPMTLLMLYIHRQIPRDRRTMLPPKQITKEVVSDLGADVLVDDRSELEAVSLASHLAYGAAGGAAYMLIAPRDIDPALKGTLYGLAVWTGSYLGWLPLLDVRPSATERPATENAMMIAAHVVYGMFLGKLSAAIVNE